jgi:hypothetical protein
MVAHSCHPRMWGSINGRILFQAGLGVKLDPVSKKPRQRIEMHYTHKDSIRQPTKHCLKTELEQKRDWDYNGGVNLFKVYCMHIWNYHSEAPLYY